MVFVLPPQNVQIKEYTIYQGFILMSLDSQIGCRYNTIIENTIYARTHDILTDHIL